MKRHIPWPFAALSTALVAVACLGMSVDSHRRFPELVDGDRLTPEVIAGKDVWNRTNCTACHTVLGEGAYAGPDLSRVALRRGAGYLRAFMHDPAGSHDEQAVGRVMPKQSLSEREISDLIAFLDWIGHVDSGGLPLAEEPGLPGRQLRRS